MQSARGGGGTLSVLNTLTASARGPAVLTCAPAIAQGADATGSNEEGVSDRVSVKLREDQLKTGKETHNLFFILH
jgi:hypothetical protein|eukprot:COSAG06_NODE_2992_length_5967_cov_4.409995_8_plen_75_part_00